MWYFAWLLGVALAICCGIISVLWLEFHYAFGEHDEDKTQIHFEDEHRRE